MHSWRQSLPQKLTTFEECTVAEKSGETLARVSSVGSCKGACSFFQCFLVHSIKLIALLESIARQ